MSIPSRFRNGVYLASHSFALLWQYPSLCIYMGIAVVVYIVVQVFVHNMPMVSPAGGECTMLIGIHGLCYLLVEFTHWLYHGVFVLVTFSYFFIVAFLQVCLIRHVLAIKYNTAAQAHYTIILRKTWTAVGSIILWSILLTILSLILRAIALSTSVTTMLFGFTFIILLVVGWFLVTFFVLPLLAAQRENVWRSMKLSCKMIRVLFIEIVGAESWMGLIALLFFIPLSIILRVLSSGVGFGIFFFSLLITIVAVLAGYIILSAQAVLKANLYCLFLESEEKINK